MWFAGAALLAVGTLLGTWIASRGAPPIAPGAGRMYPRIAGSPGQAVSVLRTVGIGSLTWYACLLAAPLLLWLARRAALGGRRRVPAIVLHLATVAVLVVVTSVAQYVLTYGSAPGRPALGTFLSMALLMNSVPLLTVAFLVHALESWRRARRGELDAARLGMQLAQARFEALTAQLQPHFLFNALQGVSTLIHRDPVAADGMLGRLSELLRDVLRHDARQEVPLDEELRVLEGYLDISRRRLGARLAIDVNASDEARGALVPFFLLQPIVENAVEHAVAPRVNGGRIGIRAERAGDELHIVIEDDGPGIDSSTRRRPARNGIGLSNTRDRLRALYGEAQWLELTEPAEGGVRVAIAMPFRLATAEARR